MTPDTNRNQASNFSRTPKLLGVALFLLGMLVSGAGTMLGNASLVVSIAGGAMCLVGAFVFGFSWLVQVMNKSPRQENNGPSA